MFDSGANDGKEGDGKELDMQQIVEDASIFGFPKGVDDETHGNSVGDQAIAGIAIAMSSVLDVAVCPYIRHGQDVYHNPAMSTTWTTSNSRFPDPRTHFVRDRVVERNPPRRVGFHCWLFPNQELWVIQQTNKQTRTKQTNKRSDNFPAKRCSQRRI